MYPAEFDYRQPASVTEAVEALDADGARVIAGGHSLLPALKARSTSAETVVDITELDTLDRIEHDDDRDETVLGAATTYADILADGTIADHAPMVAEAIAAVGDLQIRNRGTVGGNLVQADAGADIPAAATAADARVDVQGPEGTRTMSAADLYPDIAAASDPEPVARIEPDELVTTVHVPDAAGAGAVYERKTHQASGYAVVGVAVRVWLAGDEIDEVRVAATGLRRRPVRLGAVEAALVGRPARDDSLVADAATKATADRDVDRVRSDPNVSGAYRCRVLESYVEQAVGRAVTRARSNDSPDAGGRTAREGDSR